MVRTIVGSMTSKADMEAACADIDVVFLNAALIAYWQRLPFQ